MIALSLDPLSGAWYLLMLVTGHSVSLATSLIACLMLGALGAAAELVARSPARPAKEPDPALPSIFGPGGHSGSGLLTRVRSR
jgi:hypothetical protein